MNFGSTPILDMGKVWINDFKGTDDTIILMKNYALGDEGERNVRVRQWSETIVKNINPKDYLSEILAIRHWCTGPMFRYTNDARHVEQVKTPARILLEIESQGVSLVDCDDISTLIAALGLCIGREAGFVMAKFNSNQFTHVFARLREPRSGKWIVCDPVAGTRESEMLRSAKEFRFVSLES
jgi:hypothetical protein